MKMLLYDSAQIFNFSPVSGVVWTIKFILTSMYVTNFTMHFIQNLYARLVNDKNVAFSHLIR